METHICPTCSQPCVYKQGIMCTITGCIKDNTAPGNWDTVNNLMNIFGMKNDGPQTNQSK